MLIYSRSSISTFSFQQRTFLRRFAGGLATAAKAAYPTPICVPRVTTSAFTPALVKSRGLSVMDVTPRNNLPFLSQAPTCTKALTPHNRITTLQPNSAIQRIHTAFKATSLHAKRCLPGSSIDANSDLSSHASC